MVYRNYKIDPVLGRTSHCVSVTDIGSLENDATPVEVHYGDTVM